jgi:beta-glucosidase
MNTHLNPHRFPDGFVWGTATAAHQVEGGNWNSDWWDWEHAPGTPCAEPSHDACDHFHRYPQDIAMLAGLGFGSYRFSVEWARVEPEEGWFSRATLDHYRRVVSRCRDHGVEPVVTLHHFTSPRWVAAAGGWSSADTAARFERYAEQVAAALGDEVARWCTINEPNMVATIGYLVGQFPPGHQDRGERDRANEVFVDAHRRAAAAVRSRSAAPVGLTLAMQEMVAVADEGDTDGRAAAEGRVRRALGGLEDPFLEAARVDDYLGVQTYTRERFGPAGRLGGEDGVPLTQMGYEFWPEALAHCLRRAWTETDQTPLLVTENGISTTDDTERIEYVRRALLGVLACLADGIDVRGYTYWSLLDNFEWAYGYRPTFGLVAVDRTTQERTVKPSAQWLGAVARANALDA